MNQTHGGAGEADAEQEQADGHEQVAEGVEQLVCGEGDHASEFAVAGRPTLRLDRTSA